MENKSIISNKKIGRPSEYSEDAVITIIKSIELGNYPETAAQAAGIAKSTFYLWLKKHPEFVTRVRLAEARAEMNLASLVMKSANSGEWNAAKWLMSRRYRERWGDDAPIHIESTGTLVIKSDDDKEQLEM